MNLLVYILRKLMDLKFALLRLSVIQDIPTDRFNAIAKELLASGWVKTYEYDNFDAWVDYGRIDLKKGSVKLKFEWDNWTEGQIIGPRDEVEAVARQYGFSASERMKWLPRPHS